MDKLTPSYKLSVIVPMYNSSKYIGRTLFSILNQTLDSIQVIIIDDSSTDNSVEIVKGIMAMPRCDKTIKLIELAENRGASFARNMGLTLSDAEYVIYCDSDDYLEQDAYEKMYCLAVSSGFEVIACGCWLEFENSSKVLRFSKEFYNHDDFFRDFNELFGPLYSSLWNKMIRRDFILKHRIESSESLQMWDDLYFTFQLRFWASGMIVLNEPLYHYVIHEGSLSRDSFYKRVDSQVRCARLISNFVNKQNKSDNLSVVIDFIKFISKDGYFHPATMDIYKSIYQDCYKSFREFKYFFPISKRVRYKLIHSDVSGGVVLIWRLLLMIKVLFKRIKYRS